MSAEKHTLPLDAIVSYFLEENASIAQAAIEEWKNRSNLNHAFSEAYIFNNRLLREYNTALVTHNRQKLSERQLLRAEPLPEHHRKALRAVVEVLYEAVLEELTEAIRKKMREKGL